MDTHDVSPRNIHVKPDFAGADFITVAASHGPLLTKRWRRNAAGDPVAEDYGSAKVFDFTQKPIRNLDDLANVVADISPTQCLILGKLKDGVDRVGARRLLHDQKDGTAATIEDAAHYWLPIDADSIPANDKRGEFNPLTDPQRAVDCIIKQLPDEFVGADCVWQWTGSAGMKPGIRMRLFFWLSRPLTGAEMKTWLLGCPVDTSIYTPTQPIYAAAPIFDGIVDPIPRRTGAVQGWSPSVMPPAILAATREPRPAPEGFEPDRPENVEQYPRYLHACIAQATSLEAGSGHWSRDGDMNTFRLAAVGKDKGLSPERTVELLIAELPGGIGADEEWLEITVKNAFEYGSSAPGCDAIPTNEQVFADVEEPTDEAVFAGVEVWADHHTAASGKGSSDFIEHMRQQRRATPGYTSPEPAPLCMTAAELDAYVAPPSQDVWLGLLPEQLVTLLYADGGIGKTLLDQWIAVHVAAGLPLFDRAVKQQAVIMVLCEDDYRRIQSSMRQICLHVGVKFAGLPITFYCTPEDPMLAVIEDKGEISHRPFLRLLVDKIAGLGECLVVLDTVSDIAELNENLRLPVNSLCKRVLQPICKELGATILVNCHPSQNQIEKGRMGSGTTAWKNAVRSRLVMFPDKDVENWLTLSNKRVHGGKNNYGESDPLRLKREGVIFSVAPSSQRLPDGNVHEGFVGLCAREAIRQAEVFGRPIVRPNPTYKKSWNTWPDGIGHLAAECEHFFGVVPGAAHFWQHLHHARVCDYLSYATRANSKGNKPAGYYRGPVALPVLQEPKIIDGAGVNPF